ncbi:hypothetical protein Tco_0255208 [Tanacetum coccineum]
MHNNIMAAGSRDRPPMLATGRYAQWRSRFLRYIDTKTNGDALRKCILEDQMQPTKTQRQSEIANANHTFLRSASEEDFDPEQLEDKGKCRKIWLYCKNDNQSGQFGNQRTMTVAGARETVGSQNATRLHVSQGRKMFDVLVNKLRNGCSTSKQSNLTVETVDSNVIPDSPNMCDKDIQNDQNAVEYDDERATLANLIANLKLDIDLKIKRFKAIKETKQLIDLKN